MSDELIDVWTTYEREYRVYEDKFYKRSFRPEEYRLGFRKQLFIPPLGFERLQNETTCLDFVRRKTNIPVPDILEAYNEDGSFVLVTKRLLGVKMNELLLEDQGVVMEEVERHLRTLQSLQSNRTGGPSGIVCPPRRAAKDFPDNTVWSAKVIADQRFVFCHCDLSQSNIIVNPETLKIEGIIDWEYAGFWPDFFESPYFRDPQPSGAQFRDKCGNTRLVDFLCKQARSSS